MGGEIFIDCFMKTFERRCAHFEALRWENFRRFSLIVNIYEIFRCVWKFMRSLFNKNKYPLCKQIDILTVRCKFIITPYRLIIISTEANSWLYFCLPMIIAEEMIVTRKKMVVKQRGEFCFKFLNTLIHIAIFQRYFNCRFFFFYRCRSRS